MPVPQPYDICLSIRSIAADESPDTFRTLDSALAILAQVRPDRLEWSYVKDDEQVAALKAHAPVFVAALNTIFPPGHAVDIEGEPIIAPWMRKFGRPNTRLPYICMNNPDDLAARVEQITDLVTRGIATAFQFDDWYGNAQMYGYPSACFCDHCQVEFARYLNIDLNYRDYLQRRGIASNARLFELAAAGEVPLWADYRRFADVTVRRFLQHLRRAMARATGDPPVLSVNGLANQREIGVIRGMVEYLHGETWRYTPTDLFDLAEKARALGVTQISSFFPDVPADQYHASDFVRRVRRGIAVAYAVGIIPLFPYDVYAGDQPRWFGTWEEYAAPYEFVRAHREYFTDYLPHALEEDGDIVVVTTRHRDTGLEHRHRITADGHWDVT